MVSYLLHSQYQVLLETFAFNRLWAARPFAQSSWARYPVPFGHWTKRKGSAWEPRGNLICRKYMLPEYSRKFGYYPVWRDCREIGYTWYNYPTFWTCIKVKEHLNNEKARWEAKDGEDDSWSTDLLDAAQAAREKHLSHVQEMFGREKEARERFSVSSFSFSKKSIDFMPGAGLLMIDSTWYWWIAKDKLHEHHQDLLGRERAANEAKCLWDEYCLFFLLISYQFATCNRFLCLCFQNRHRDVHEVIQKERSAREQPFPQTDSKIFKPFPKP